MLGILMCYYSKVRVFSHQNGALHAHKGLCLFVCVNNVLPSSQDCFRFWSNSGGREVGVDSATHIQATDCYNEDIKRVWEYAHANTSKCLEKSMMYSSNAILAQGPCKTLIHIKVKKKVYTMDKHYRHLNYHCNNEMRHCFVLRCLDLYRLTKILISHYRPMTDGSRNVILST